MATPDRLRVRPSASRTLTLPHRRDENNTRTFEVLAMLTKPIDKALEALTACRQHVPFLRDLYRLESPERAAPRWGVEGGR
jgi:hypothetical protein